jgi:hypothetical protein
MLGPALRQSFLELDQFGQAEPRPFENDLHRGLLQVAEIIGAAQRAITPQHREMSEPPSFAAIRTYVGPATGPAVRDVDLGTRFSRSSKADSPNKRIK